MVKPNAALTGHIAAPEACATALTITSAATLVQKYHTIGIETLNVSGMIKAGLQSKALAPAGMSGLLDKIRYKAARCGATVVEAGQWYPSSSRDLFGLRSGERRPQGRRTRMGLPELWRGIMTETKMRSQPAVNLRDSR